LKGYKWQKFHDLNENRLFLPVYDYLLEKSHQNFEKKEDFEEKEGKRVIIIDMMSLDTDVCQIDLQ
tara:strand:+ start:269 stop:466 length:198 start_codon:yes stop_codon:yes gene_type:complete